MHDALSAPKYDGQEPLLGVRIYGLPKKAVWERINVRDRYSNRQRNTALTLINLMYQKSYNNGSFV